MRRDKIQRGARGFGVRLGGAGCAAQAVSEGPSPDVLWQGGEDSGYALLFGGADIGERAAGLLDFADGFGGSAFGH